MKSPQILGVTSTGGDCDCQYNPGFASAEAVIAIGRRPHPFHGEILKRQKQLTQSVPLNFQLVIAEPDMKCLDSSV